jgi:hypothetical protein
MSQLTTLKFSPPSRKEGTLDLTALSNLEILSLEGKIRTSISHLTKLTSLKIRCFENNCPADLTIFSKLTTLDISLNGQPLPRINARALESFTLCSASNMTHLDFLKDFVNLTSFRVQLSNKLEDVSAITTLTKLTTLAFCYCNDICDIPDLTELKNLKLLVIKELRNLGKLPKINKETRVDETKGWENHPWYSSLNAENLIIRDDAKRTTLYITKVKQHSLIHLENLTNLSTFKCYFPLNVKDIFLSGLGLCESIDLLQMKETQKITITNCPLVKTIAFHAKGLIELEIANLPKLEKLTIKDFPAIATMELPTFVEREGSEVLKFKPVNQAQMSSFITKLNRLIIQYNSVSLMAEKSSWKLFYDLMQQENYFDYIKIIDAHFKIFDLMITPRKAAAIPFAAKLYYLPKLSPDHIKTTVTAVGETTLKQWREEKMDFEGTEKLVCTALHFYKVSYLDKGLTIPAVALKNIDKIPGRSFMAAYLAAPHDIEPYFPLMNQPQLTVTIPMLTLQQFQQLCSKNVGYAVYATSEQKKG